VSASCAINSVDVVGTGSYTITIQPALAITTTSLSNAQSGVRYTTTLQASGGIPPYTWSVSSGSLPAGLIVDGITGVVAGTPTTAGTSNVQITVTDSLGAHHTESYAFTVTGPLDHLTLSPASAPIAPRGSETYTVEGYDASNNDLGPVTDAILSITPDGSCTAYTCTATGAGAHTVTASDGTAKGTALLTVTSAAAVVNTIPVGSCAVGVSSDGTHVWVANDGDDTVSEIQISPAAP
jgi:Putative Ig domain